MNRPLFNSYMAKYPDTQASLAAAMGLSPSRLNAKINEARGAAFNQTEMTFIIERYGISSDEACNIFFNQKVSQNATLEDCEA